MPQPVLKYKDIAVPNQVPGYKVHERQLRVHGARKHLRKDADVPAEGAVAQNEALRGGAELDCFDRAQICDDLRAEKGAQMRHRRVSRSIRCYEDAVVLLTQRRRRDGRGHGGGYRVDEL